MTNFQIAGLALVIAIGLAIWAINTGINEASKNKTL